MRPAGRAVVGGEGADAEEQYWQAKRTGTGITLSLDDSYCIE